jgi:hypothetical protein
VSRASRDKDTWRKHAQKELTNTLIGTHSHDTRKSAHAQKHLAHRHPMYHLRNAKTFLRGRGILKPTHITMFCMDAYGWSQQASVAAAASAAPHSFLTTKRRPGLVFHAGRSRGSAKWASVETDRQGAEGAEIAGHSGHTPACFPVVFRPSGLFATSYVKYQRCFQPNLSRWLDTASHPGSQHGDHPLTGAAHWLPCGSTPTQWLPCDSTPCGPLAALWLIADPVAALWLNAMRPSGYLVAHCHAAQWLPCGSTPYSTIRPVFSR